MQERHKNTRIGELDYLKCVCIVLMVVFHLVYIEGLYPSAKQVVYTFHMPVFLIISGYFVDLRRELARQLRSLRRLLAPYLIMEAAYICGAAFLPIREHIDSLTMPVFLDLLLLHPLGPYWYLHTLIIGCGISTIVAQAGRKAGLSTAPVLIILATVLFTVSHYLGIISAPSAFYLLAGVTLRYLAIDILSIFKGSCLSLIPIALICIAGGYESFGLLSIALAYLFVSLFLAVYNTHLPASAKRVTHFIGANTLPIFLFSPLFTFLLKPAVPLLSFDPTGLLYAALSVCIAVPGGLLLAKLLHTLHIPFPPLQPY